MLRPLHQSCGSTPLRRCIRPSTGNRNALPYKKGGGVKGAAHIVRKPGEMMELIRRTVRELREKEGYDQSEDEEKMVNEDEDTLVDASTYSG